MLDPSLTSRGDGHSGRVELKPKVMRECISEGPGPAPMLQYWLNESFHDGPFHNIGAVAHRPITAYESGLRSLEHRENGEKTRENE